MPDRLANRVAGRWRVQRAGRVAAAAAALACCMVGTVARPLACAAAAEGEAARAAAGGDEAAATGKGEPTRADSAEPEISVSDEGVTVHAVSVYAHRLFTRLAEATNIQVVVDDAIKDRKVTVHLTSKSAGEVINHIVSAYGLSCGQVNGVYMISEGIPRKPSSYLLSDIVSIPTQYVQADNAKGLLPVFLQDHVKVNREQNAVVLSGPSDVLRKFGEDIRQFDIPAAQILLEILVVEFTDADSALRDLGVRWQNAGRGGEWGTLPLPPPGDNPYLEERSMGEVVVRGVAELPPEFRARLEALVSERRARVRASPRVATVSGQYANFFVGIQRYLRQPIEVPGARQDEWGGGTRTTNFIDAGVRLNVSPWTGDGKEIICRIETEVSTLSALDPVTGLPEKITRTADTMVRVRDGCTVVIGGLQQDEQRRVRTKVPLLGDLPLVGSLFRSRDTVTTKTDLVVFITPRVLSQTAHLSPQEEAQLHDQFLGGK